MALALSNGTAVKLSELPAIEDVPPNERMRLFRQKLKLCCVLYDFSDVRKHVREKEAKRNALLQIVEYISAGKVIWDASVVADLLECVGANIFRMLGRRPTVVTTNADGKTEGKWLLFVSVRIYVILVYGAEGCMFVYEKISSA
jgi:serine/threonine-protein phosphatase 2A regulatory subunit B'